jgi:hypothetical protein
VVHVHRDQLSARHGDEEDRRRRRHHRQQLRGPGEQGRRGGSRREGEPRQGGHVQRSGNQVSEQEADEHPGDGGCRAD